MGSSKLVFIPIRNIVDNRGTLSVFELPNFETKRFFWIKPRDPLHKRGGHSHKKCTQILFAIAGEIELEILET